MSFTPYYYVNNGDGYQEIPDSLTITNGTPLAYFGSRRLWLTDRVGSQGRFFPYGEDRTGMNYPQSGQYAFATYLDNGSGVYYADQRWYAAAPGRFLSPDRHHARSRTRNPQDLNLFSYTSNDPINRADPSGLAYCDVDFGICYYGDDDDDDDDDDDCVGTEGFSYVTGASCPVGNAPPQPDPIDCDIQLLTQDAVFQGDPAQHTILEVEIPDANSYFLEAGPVPFTRLGIAGPSWLNASVETTAPMYHLPTTAIYGWEEPESVCERLLTTFGSYKQNTILYNNIPTAVFWGPNSNSFTHSLLNTAGLSVPWWMSPWLLVYAPGWINTSVPF
jgi:RHS repeat-associated protein